MTSLRNSEHRRREHPTKMTLEGVTVVGAATLVVFGVCFIALWIFAGPGRKAERKEIVIPAGTYALIDAGENPLNLPANWSLRSGDILVFDNRDQVGHYVGPWFSPRNEITEVIVNASASLTLFCSLHPDGQINIDVTPRRSDWTLAVWPSLMVGVPFGLILLMVRQLMRRLEDPESFGDPDMETTSLMP